MDAPSTRPAPESGPEVRIHRPARSVMQSGKAATAHWVIDPEPVYRSAIEPLMGWTASRDTLQQVLLTFPDRDSAIAFATHRGWRYTVSEPKTPARHPKSYLQNFRGRH